MTDFERKVYQIIVNMRLYGKNPTLNDLKRKTGKNEQEIRATMKSLMMKGELKWDKKKEKWIFLNVR
ncbi:hypothetical protein [Bacillus atrophaeus]|uniref:hypothetical protein n=1 Tax=Bacillus atrophaeus TaxID=1452 RepID=UPI00123BC938|nr:hypothetical protein [Bacillus atrophaeus]KAA6447027.1 hypothetical protein DX926_16480 [Bacillus atrophaeus]